MTHHVVSKGLANPTLLLRVRLRVAGHRDDEKRADALSAGCYSPLRAGKVSDPAGHVKHNQNIRASSAHHEIYPSLPSEKRAVVILSEPSCMIG